MQAKPGRDARGAGFLDKAKHPAYAAYVDMNTFPIHESAS